MDYKNTVFETINFLDNNKTSMHNVIRLQIKMQIHDLNGRFKKSNMKIVSSFNALFPALLLHEKKKRHSFLLAGRVCNNIFVLLRLFGIFIPLYSNRNSRVVTKCN